MGGTLHGLWPRVELYVGDATRAVPPDRVRDIVTVLTAS